MKYVSAVIQNHRLEPVREALSKVGIDSLIVTEVKRYGPHEEHREFYRGADFEVGFEPKTRVDFAVADEHWEKAVKKIRDAAFTGETGDGRIFVYDLSHSIQIRSGRTDREVEVL